MSTASSDRNVYEAIDQSFAFAATLNLNGQYVRSIAEGLAIIKTLSPKDVYPAALMIQDHAHGVMGDAVRSLQEVHDFVELGEFWKTHEQSLESFRDSWQVTRDAVKVQEGLDRFKANVRKRAILQWGEQQANVLLTRMGSYAMLRKVSKAISEGLSYPDLQTAINNAIVYRKSRRGRGIRQYARIMQIDLDVALARRNLEPLNPQTLHALELGVDMDGFVCSIGSDCQMQPPEIVPPVPPAQPTGAANAADPPRSPEKRPRDDTPSSILSPLSSLSSTPSVPSDDELDEQEHDELDEQEHDELDEQEHDEDDDDEPLPRPQKRLRPTPKNPLASCGCALTNATIRRLLRGTELPTDTLKKQLLRQVGKAMATRSAIYTSPSLSLCNLHVHGLCKRLGLYCRAPYKELLRRLRELYANLGAWDTMKGQHKGWFKNVLSNLESGWRFPVAGSGTPRIANPALIQSLTFARLYKRCCGRDADPTVRDLGQQLDRDGSIVLPGLFEWLGEDFDGNHPGGLRHLIMEEFNMYDWHYLARPCKPRIGWARNMWFSVVQQLVRQDPAYYAFYVRCRPDHAWKLVSFPYYAKRTYPGERTFFRHIDVNIIDFVRSGRGVNALQGSLALSDEDSGNCTELLLGMHREIATWHGRLIDRGYAKDGYVQRIDADMWTEDDEAHFGYGWTKQICRFGDVRLSLPGLPHGSTGPATAQRVNILPWFVAIGDDHQTLDTAESGTWDDLSRCHRDFHSGTKTPSGLPNSTYGGRVDYKFPATVRLGRLGAISDALVGQTRWDTVDVRRELDVLFGDDDDMAYGYVQSWRRNAQQLYCAAFENLVVAEKEAFGENSYFYRRERNLSIIPEFIRDGVQCAGSQHPLGAPGPPDAEVGGVATGAEDMEA
ncbi:hypothetical protein N7536_003877 [Penicillium majusculum]|nr:hypothetical protein N7536_002224 [Penicillium majusculum]KAJ5700864.1 hypothetical protein N7536_003877 [Penicillium majusculum]